MFLARGTFMAAKERGDILAKIVHYTKTNNRGQCGINHDIYTNISVVELLTFLSQNMLSIHIYRNKRIAWGLNESLVETGDGKSEHKY